MAQALVIFDCSGSMNGERYKSCRQACMQFRENFELWLFGDNVQKMGVVPSVPEFPCQSGTSITTMLNELHAWMSVNTNKYVYILTDGEDQYDEVGFTNKFNQISNHNHQVTVYDICRTNVEPLKRIFAKFSIAVATNIDEITQLLQNLQGVMANDKVLIAAVTSVGSNVQRIVENYAKLETASEQLKVITTRLKSQNQTVTAAAEQAINNRKVEQLKQAAEQLKQHLTEMADHVKQLKQNQREVKRLKEDVEEQQDNIDNLRDKIKLEENSPNANQQKIAAHRATIQEHERKQNVILQKIEILKKNSAETVEDFAKLYGKTSDTQSKVTITLTTL